MVGQGGFMASPSNGKPEDRDDATKVLSARLESGEAWMRCVDCGARLYSFDGPEDASRKCPYKC